MMNRRDLIAGFGGATLAWPFAVRAQQTFPLVGYLDLAKPRPQLDEALRAGLEEYGFVDGKTVRIEHRSAEGHDERLAQLAADLVALRVAVIAAPGSPNAPLAAKAATSSIPIVFAVGADPVELGLVQSMSRPGGNATGVTYRFIAMTAKRLELVRYLVPDAKIVAVFIDPTLVSAKAEEEEATAAADTLGQQLILRHVASGDDLRAAFEAATHGRAQGIVIGSGPRLGGDLSRQIAALSQQYALPTIANNREAAVNGEIASYGADIAAGFRLVGAYIGRILKGEAARDLPVEQADKFELVINMKTANALRLTIPPTLLARADEVIE